MGITFESSGSFEKTRRRLQKMSNRSIFNALNKYGAKGVAALAAATPKESGETAAAWSYEVKITGTTAEISWKNSHKTATGTPVAIMLQFGHGTGTGGYVAGRDFINPAIKPIFDQISNDVWKAVTSS